jgi:hypothetical protein
MVAEAGLSPMDATTILGEPVMLLGISSPLTADPLIKDSVKAESHGSLLPLAPSGALGACSD